MVQFIGQLIGATLAAALLGVPIAWLFRRLVPMSVRVSYFLGFAAFAVLAAIIQWETSAIPRPLEQSLLLYGLGAAIAFVMMARHPRAPESHRS